MTLSVKDWDGDTGTTGIEVGAVTAVSLPGLLTQIGAYRTAVDGLIIGEMAKEQLSAFITILSQDNADVPEAQANVKWLVKYHDNTQFFDAPVNAIPNAGYLKAFTLELPTADLSLLEDNQTFLDLSVNPGLAYVTAAQAMGRSPYGGAVIIDSIEFAE